MRIAASLSLLVAALAPVGCMVGEDEPAEALGRRQDDIASANALTTNALISNALTKNTLTANALTKNALTKNALTVNALTKNALTSTEVRPDGLIEGAISRTVLAYIYSCAMPEGAALDLEIDGVSYGTLHGSVGLAPQWGAEDGLCDGDCQRWVSACLLARINYWGKTVPISLRGNHPALAVSEAESAEYPLREGTYFGNVFGEDAIYPYSDGMGGTWCSTERKPVLRACSGEGSNESWVTSRVCSSGSTSCSIDVLGRCTDSCDAPDAATGAYGACRTSCTDIWSNDPYGYGGYGGGYDYTTGETHTDSYPQSITVYLKQPVAICGNDLCEGSETAASCAVDCPAGWAAVPILGYSELYHLAAADDGSVVVASTFSGTIDLGAGPLVNAGYADVMVARYAPGGETLWSKRFGSVDRDWLGGLAVDGAGAIYLLVSFDGTTSFGGPTMTQNGTYGDHALVKLGPTGEFLWQKQFDSLSSPKIAADAAGGVTLVTGILTGAVVDGVTYTSNGSYDLLLVRYDGDGVARWHRQHGGAGSEEPAALAVDAAGNVFVALSFTTPTNLGGATLTSVGSYDMGVAKYAATSGAHLWSRRLGGMGDERVHRLATDPATGWVVLGGYVGATSDLGGFTVELGASAYAGVVVALDGAGTARWARAITSPQNAWIGGLGVAANGNVVVGASIGNGASWGGASTVASFGEVDAMIAVYTRTGAPLQARRFGLTSGDPVHGLAVNAGGDVVFTGPRRGEPGVAVPRLYSAGGAFAHLTKLDGFAAEGGEPVTCIAAAEVCNGLDDDCDGAVDDGFSLGVSCDGSDGDMCREGVTVCSADGAGTMCSDATASTVEVCGNAADENCNGQVNEGCPGKGRK